MTTSNKKLIYLPQATRAKNNFVRARLRSYLKDLIEANDYECTNLYSANIDIIHYPSAIDFLENDDPVKDKKGFKKYVINAFTNTEEFENNDEGIPILKKEVVQIFNNAFTVIVFFDTQKIALRHLGVTSPIQVIYPIGKKLVVDTEIHTNAFKKAYGILPYQKYVINYGSYEKNSGFEDFENLARIMPDLEFFYFGNRPLLFSSTKRYEKAKNVYNLHFENYPPEELLSSMFSSMVSLLISDNRHVDCLYLADCMYNKIPIVIQNNSFMEEFLKDHALVANNLDDFYKHIHDIIQESKVEEAYEYINNFTLDSEKEKLDRIYDKYIKL